MSQSVAVLGNEVTLIRIQNNGDFIDFYDGENFTTLGKLVAQSIYDITLWHSYTQTFQ